MLPLGDAGIMARALEQDGRPGRQALKADRVP